MKRKDKDRERKEIFDQLTTGNDHRSRKEPTMRRCRPMLLRRRLQLLEDRKAFRRQVGRQIVACVSLAFFVTVAIGSSGLFYQGLPILPMIPGAPTDPIGPTPVPPPQDIFYFDQSDLISEPIDDIRAFLAQSGWNGGYLEEYEELSEFVGMHKDEERICYSQTFFVMTNEIFDFMQLTVSPIYNFISVYEIEDGETIEYGEITYTKLLVEDMFGFIKARVYFEFEEYHYYFDLETYDEARIEYYIDRLIGGFSTEQSVTE